MTPPLSLTAASLPRPLKVMALMTTDILMIVTMIISYYLMIISYYLMIPKKTYPPARELAVLDQAKANRDTFPAETEHDLDLSELIVCNYTYAAETEHKWIKHIFFFPTFWIRKYSGGQNKKWVGGSKIELEPYGNISRQD